MQSFDGCGTGGGRETYKVLTVVVPEGGGDDEHVIYVAPWQCCMHVNYT